ncbi:hypothetical protein EST38_g3226 [Candolleomyces aberdarensis]|uniref:Nephrocystin 3-like N-terminal domain-containing protein n=1 Tax=Candolleomyces aberdarensis TaxID=2316362 RepID=A0A4Q2DQG1_9AGAR|nr:hypothetical protein EST38_g3226 [Candolleomyces aberdarensis]
MADGAVDDVTEMVIGHVENAIIGDNLGTINQGRENSRPAAGNFQHVAIGKLDLIEVLQPIPDASHTRDREISPPNSACFPGTRQEVIRAIVSWAKSSLLFNTHVLWLYGYVGCGKSAIALAVALKLERSNRLVGSFFFFRNTGDRSRMTKFATTLACQLAAAIPEAAPFIEEAVKAEPDLLGSSVVSQLRRLVYEPFKAAAKRGRLLKTFLLKGPFLIVIDGLDECEDRRDVEGFIDDMLEFFKKNPLVPLRFFITSRIEQHIQARLKNDQVRLENLANHCSRHDIDTFLSTCFEDEKSRNPVIKAYTDIHGEWPMRADKDQLVIHIGGSFIFACSLFKYIVDPTNYQSTPMERLPHTLKMNPGLDTLYAQTLARSQHLPHFPEIISTLALLFEPLPIVGIAELLGIESLEVIRVLVNLQAIIHIPGTDELPVTLCHTSLRDFLTAESRSGCFFASPYHLHLSYRCYIMNSQTAGASYGIGRWKEHLEQFARLPPSVQGLFPCFPETLDALYAHILSKSQDLPHFPTIISTIAILFEPLPIVGIAELLGIEASEVVQVLASLRAIIRIPGDNGSAVTLHHTSLRDFLTTESRSGRFFASPYHLHLVYRCFILREEQQSGTATASYSTNHCEDHIEQFIRLPPSAQGPFPRFPETLDALYAHILSKSQDLPHFSTIISTIAILFEPLPIVGIVGLLGIDASEVVRILAGLRAIIHAPGDNESAVTFHHTSLRDFLTTESRSGRFFASPYHLHLLYRCFILREEQQSGTAAASYSTNHCEEHIEQFIRLLPSAQGPFPRFPETLDALYAHILSKSQDLPHFSTIISTIAILFEPLPIVGIAGLLGIEAAEVVRVLVGLRAIIHTPGDNESAVTLHHASLRDFLSTKRRSGRFFASPYHLHLLYRCFILREEQQSGTAAASYSTDYCEEHIEQFIRLPPSAQGPFTRFPETLDALYVHILSLSQDIPHISTLVSTIAILFKPLPIVGIAELLGIEASEVIRGLVGLRAIIHIPEDNKSAVTLRHTSLRDFLTTESRSGCFFASPYHFYLLLRCFILREEQQSGTAAASYSTDHCEEHVEQFIRLPPSAQGTFPRFPETLDALYTYVLSKSQDLPHFSTIVSTIAILLEPLPIVGIAGLLGIEASEVRRALDGLRAIILIPGDNESAVTLHHTSLRDFLTTESRSRRFFASPYHHLHLSYRCLILREEQQSGTAVASYSTGHCEEHIEQFIRLPPSAQGPFPRFPETLDALYAHILTKSQDLPRFPDIISTIALVLAPLPIVWIAELLEIECVAVVRVLNNLRDIIHITGTDLLPVTSRHAALRDFLTTKSRSGPFFVSPSYQLRIYYRCFTLNIGHFLAEGRPSRAIGYSSRCCQDHSAAVPATVLENILVELEQLNRASSQALPYPHFLIFMLLSSKMLGRYHGPAEHILGILTKCMEFLALTLERDPVPAEFLHKTFQPLGFSGVFVAKNLAFKVHQEQVKTLQHNLERIEAAIQAKVSLIPSFIPSGIRTNSS